MATLTNYIRLVDGASGPLKSIANAGSRAIYSLAGMAGGTAGVHKVSEALAGVERNAESATNAMARMNNTVSNFTPAQRMSARYGMAGRMYNAGQNAMQNVKQNVMPKVTQTVQRVIRFVPDRIIGDTGLAARAFSAIESAANKARMSINKVPSAMHEVGGAAGQVDNAANSFKRLAGSIGKIGAGTMIGMVATMAADKLLSSAGQLVSVAGQYAGIQARLKLLVGEQSKVVEMNEAIYQSALRSRGSFEQMADAVTKIGMTAKEAFPDPKQVVPFVEGIQKLFAIGGTGVQQQADAMLQLTQALGSGKLQGDEFRSIAEAAPMIEQMVAKYMGVTQGALKDLSSKGEITADILKNAILSNLDEINSQFATMPATFDQQMQKLSTIASKAFAPVYDEINKIIGGEGMKKIISSISSIFPVLANEALYVLRGLVNNVEWAFGVINQHSDLLKTVLGGIIIALTIFGTVSAVNYGIAAAGAIGHAIATGFQIAALVASTIATEGLSAALYACPLTWVIGLVIALALVFYGAIQAINYFAGTSISAAGIVFAVFAFLFTNLVNGVKFVANAFIAFANALGSMFVDPLGAIYNIFADIWNGIVSLVGSAVNSIIDMINTIPGISLSNVSVEGITATRKEISGAAFHIDPFEYGNAAYNAQAAYDYGASGNWLPDMPKMPDVPETPKNPAMDTPAMPSAGAGGGGAGKAIAGNTGRTADNTGRMADSLDLLEEDIKDMRYATQEQINKYTNAKVTIDVGGINNTISSDTDVDGVMSKIVEALQEGMSNGAEAVLY